MVRGRRPRLQTNRVYPCRFVSIRGSPVAKPFGNHLERRFGRGGDAVENPQFKFAVFGKSRRRGGRIGPLRPEHSWPRRVWSDGTGFPQRADLPARWFGMILGRGDDLGIPQENATTRDKVIWGIQEKAILG